MNNVSVYRKLNRTISTLLKSVFKNERVYIFCFLLPFVLSSALFLAYHKFSNNEILPPTIISFNLLCVFITGLFVGILLIEWKNKDFLRRVKLFGINYFSLTAIIFCISVIISIPSFILTTFIQVAESDLFSFKLTDNDMLSNITWYIWLLVLLCVALLTIVVSSVISLIVFLMNNKILATASIFAAFMFMLLLSDIIIIPSYSSSNRTYVYITYFNPAKYCVWLVLLFSSYTFIDYYGIYQIVNGLHISYIISFKEIWSPMFISLLWIILFELIGWKLIRWGAKG